MRHGKVGRKLQRTASHRKATLSALSVALITHKRITTTVAKAKETRMVVEKMITRAKNAVAGETEEAKNVHARRIVFSQLRDRDAVVTLFNEVAPKVASRPGGYTRVVKLGQRRGDGAEMAIIELVDFNIGTDKPAKTAKKPATKKKSTKTAEKEPEAGNAEEAQEPTAEPKEKKPVAKAKPKTKGKKAGGKDTSSAKA